MSAGGRSTHGTSARTPRQILPVRHSRVGSQVKPDSMQTSFQVAEIPGTRLRRSGSAAGSRTPPIARHNPRPDRTASRRGRRVAIGAAGMDADRQAVLFARRRRSASSCRRPSGMSPIASISTWTKRLSGATRSISATASSGLCNGTTIEARSRGSRSSSSFATQSLTARQTPPPCPR